MSCYKYEASHYLRGRHVGACDGEMCSGCEPCTERHCACRRHLADGDQTCPTCVSHIRRNLNNIEDRAAMMPTEAIHRGVNSEAANLAGPATDPEAWSWRKAALAKRNNVPLSTLEEDDPHHPKTVLASWERAFREDYDNPTNLEWTVSRGVDYLLSILTRVARDEHQDMAQFGRELRTCLAHLDAVLHDQGQGDPAGVGCFDCGGSLERRLLPRKQHTHDHRRDTGGFEDHWTCSQCRRRYTYAEYNFALRAALEGRTA